MVYTESDSCQDRTPLLPENEEGCVAARSGSKAISADSKPRTLEQYDQPAKSLPPAKVLCSRIAITHWNVDRPLDLGAFAEGASLSESASPLIPQAVRLLSWASKIAIILGHPHRTTEMIRLYSNPPYRAARTKMN